jgi:hypothetical protein
VGNKLDLPGAAENFSTLRELYGGSFRCLGMAAQAPQGWERSCAPYLRN